MWQEGKYMSKVIGVGNNDGDRFEIEEVEDISAIKINIDQCGAHIYDGVIPNELLVAMISEFLMKGNGTMITAIDHMDCNDEYKDMLRSRLEEVIEGPKNQD